MVTFTGDSVTGKVSINYRLSISSSSIIADSLADLWRDVSGQTSFFPPLANRQEPMTRPECGMRIPVPVGPVATIPLRKQ